MFFVQVNSLRMLVVSVFLVMENKKALPDSWLPQHLMNVVSFTKSDDDILELHKKRTTWQPSFWTWKPVLGLLPSIIQRFWLLATILQLHVTLQNIRQENLKLIFSAESFRSNTVVTVWESNSETASMSETLLSPCRKASPMKWNVVVFAVIYRQQTTNGLSWAEQRNLSFSLPATTHMSRIFKSNGQSARAWHFCGKLSLSHL